MAAALLVQSASVDSASGAHNDLLSFIRFPSEPAEDAQGKVIGDLFFIPRAAGPCVTRLDVMLRDPSGRQQLADMRQIDWKTVIGFTPDTTSGRIAFKYAGGTFHLPVPASEQTLVARIASVLIGTCNPASGLRDPNGSPLRDACPGSAAETEALLANGVKRDQTRYFASTVSLGLGGDRPTSVTYEKSLTTPPVKTLTLRLPRPVSAYAAGVRLKYQGWTRNRYAEACQSGQTCTFEIANEPGQPVGAFLSADLEPEDGGARLACRYRG